MIVHSVYFIIICWGYLVESDRMILSGGGRLTDRKSQKKGVIWRQRQLRYEMVSVAAAGPRYVVPVRATGRRGYLVPATDDSVNVGRNEIAKHRQRTSGQLNYPYRVSHARCGCDAHAP